MIRIKYSFVSIEKQPRNNLHVHILLWIEPLGNMNDESPVKRRKVKENAGISPKKISGKRIVEHYCALVGEGYVFVDLPICPDRPDFTEAYTLPAKKAVEEKDGTGKVLTDAGYFLTVGLVGHKAINETNDEQIRNTRGYLMKALALQNDDLLTPDIMKRKLNVLTSVSSLYFIL